MGTATNGDLQPIHQQILSLVDSEAATTRATLARTLHLAPSTISLRVLELLDSGHLEEVGDSDSTGGRRARLLRLRSDSAYFIGAELGTGHARYALLDARGTVVEIRHHDIDLPAGPVPSLNAIAQHCRGLLDDHNAAASGICLALPAPVSPATGLLDSASRMPGWDGFPISQHLSENLGVPVVIENDADMMALGEHIAHPHLRHTLTVKAGSGLGVGIVIDGQVHRGATGAAGDISHVRRASYGNMPCACGNKGCLATIVAGAALLERWQRESGNDGDLEQMMRAARNGEVHATNILREAGEHLGDALCAVASFFNPEALFLAGLLSSADAFVASVRASLYRGCHPLVTRSLIIERASTGPDAGALGAAHLASTKLLKG
ncbi:ROK family transcriptional regulator [Schaalia suimastitidis]|uniref:ROK family transcriptional regulator n=1 Tax=Schaalia suimastitidis TaxID=121163 RepID=UPI0004123842|nr:ROK family transcriptional regulator [Schaalia suimastitidis]